MLAYRYLKRLALAKGGATEQSYYLLVLEIRVDT
jgi:hypothetical protein